jgi:hypothetical protein
MMNGCLILEDIFATKTPRREGTQGGSNVMFIFSHNFLINKVPRVSYDHFHT